MIESHSALKEIEDGIRENSNTASSPRLNRFSHILFSQITSPSQDHYTFREIIKSSLPKVGSKLALTSKVPCKGIISTTIVLYPIILLLKSVSFIVYRRF